MTCFSKTFNKFPKLLTRLAQHQSLYAKQWTHFLLLWYKMHSVKTNLKCVNLFYTRAQPRPKQCNFTFKFTNDFTLYVRTENIMFSSKHNLYRLKSKWTAVHVVNWNSNIFPVFNFIADEKWLIALNAHYIKHTEGLEFFQSHDHMF